MARGLLIGRRIVETGSQPDPAAVKEVLSYFVRNPQAADDLEGIARWRLLDEMIRRKVEETHRALAWLVEHEYVRETIAAGIESIFSLNLDRLAEAKAFLAGEELLAGEKKE